MKDVKVYPVELRVNPAIYDGTILEGVLIKNGDKRKFIINDAYYLNGSDIRNEKLNNKMINLKIFLKSIIYSDLEFSNIEVILNKFYDMSEIEKAGKEGQNITGVNGLNFYPEYSGIKLIYLFSDELTDIKDEVKSIHYSEKKEDTSYLEIKSKLDEIVYKSPVKQDTPKYYETFEIHKTKTFDVYELYGLVNDKDKSSVYIKHFSTALIPSAECSLYCQNLLKDKDMALIVCEYIYDKKRWVPTNQPVEKKCPSIIKNVRRKMASMNK
jgi:hypothetical protein